ncbi:DUF3833 domain-containing protein [Thiomicrorhabdus sp. Milos-T2]|uniref:DUF3833 domain-containing protein n=1 Tax=Thiomicrorhabdus sp. Milos-T2 TaxID=90814 RepID=UPI0004947B7E|nr:DUF3833 domain-containing protein [Thiomicrorhabdus sp. Milos-T2]
MKNFRYVLLLVSFLSITLISGCSSVKVQDYQNEKPQLNLFDYFKGKTFAQGQFQDRSGKVLRRFTVDITGTIEGNQLTLDERFVYNDGEKQQRIWHITKTAEGQFIGKADDVIGEAIGESAGNALNWRYTLDLPYKDSTIHVQFNDWMFLHTDTTMMNRASVTKWGFNVGEVTLFFSKNPL